MNEKMCTFFKKVVDALDQYVKDKEKVKEINTKIEMNVKNTVELQSWLKRYSEVDMNIIMKSCYENNVNLLSDLFYEKAKLLEQKKEIEKKYMKVQ
jgi:predicted nicotinamide N-methyase